MRWQHHHVLNAAAASEVHIIIQQRGDGATGSLTHFAATEKDSDCQKLLAAHSCEFAHRFEHVAQRVPSAAMAKLTAIETLRLGNWKQLKTEKELGGLIEEQLGAEKVLLEDLFLMELQGELEGVEFLDTAFCTECWKDCPTYT